MSLRSFESEKPLQVPLASRNREENAQRRTATPPVRHSLQTSPLGGRWRRARHQLEAWAAGKYIEYRMIIKHSAQKQRARVRALALLLALFAAHCVISSGTDADGDDGAPHDFWLSHSGKPLFPLLGDNAPLAVGVDTFLVRRGISLLLLRVRSPGLVALLPKAVVLFEPPAVAVTPLSVTLCASPAQIGTASVYGGELPDLFFLNSRVHAPYAPAGIFLFRARKIARFSTVHLLTLARRREQKLSRKPRLILAALCVTSAVRVFQARGAGRRPRVLSYSGANRAAGGNQGDYRRPRRAG